MNKGQEERRRLPIGIFDSGVGGLTVLRMLRQLLPHEDLVYIGDNKHNPVGNLTGEQINYLALRIATTLADRPCKAIVVACNTFTVMALPLLRSKLSIPVIGMSKGVLSALEATKTQKIGIMATVATVYSHKHSDEVKILNPAVSVVEQACPDLAHAIELGHVDDVYAKDLVSTYIDPIVDSGADTVILACTHYPFLQPLLSAYKARGVAFIDPAIETVAEVQAILEAADLMNDRRDVADIHLYFTSDVERSKELVEKALGQGVGAVDSIEL